MHNKETQFLKCNGRASIKTQLRFEFLASQRAFDKKLRHYERVYKQSVCDDIDNMSTEKPNVFLGEALKAYNVGTTSILR